MPTHAILGATGGAGSAVLHNLLESKTLNLTIKILVRSRDKLLSLMANLESPPTNITILLHQRPNSPDLPPRRRDNLPMHLRPRALQNQQHLPRRRQRYHLRPGNPPPKSPPTLLLNRSSALNPSIKVPVSVPFFYFLKWSLDSIYSDLSAAATIYTNASKSSNPLLHPIFVDAPNLFHPYSPDTKTGYEVFLTGETTLGVNYVDFGAVMVEIAERKEEFMGKGVGVRATGEVVPAWGPNLGELANGVLSKFSPF